MFGADYLTGQLLVSMPMMGDSRFTQSVIYICLHNEDGAMGLIINKPLEDLSFIELLGQLNIQPIAITPEIPIHFGGPVEMGRGFVLHSADYSHKDTINVDKDIGLTATIDILRHIAEGKGPEYFVLTLGYAGWGAGQLDSEIQRNAWLNVPADRELTFDNNTGDKWERSIAKIGIDLSLLSGDMGHA